MTGSFRQIRTFYRDYISYALHSWLLFAMIMVAGSILGMVSYDISRYDITQIYHGDAAFLSAISPVSYFYISWIVTFMCSFAISNDFTTNASSFILALPVNRNNIFVGRFLGATTITALSAAAFYVFLAMESYHYFGKVSPSLVTSYFVALLFIISVSALVFLLSSLIKIDRLVLISSFVMLFVIFPILEGVFQIYSLNVNSLLNYNAFAITRSIHPFGSFGYYDIQFVSIVPENLKLFNYDQSIISMVIYFFSLFVLGIITYRKRQVI